MWNSSVSSSAVPAMEYGRTCAGVNCSCAYWPGEKSSAFAGWRTSRLMSWVGSSMATTVALMMRAVCTTTSSGSGIYTVQGSVTKVWQART